jgi:EAL domain-containing protein (putative c-di-GMP-specific phosphodiesterase class I)
MPPIYCELLIAADASGADVVPPGALPHSADAAESVRSLERLIIREALKWMAREREALDRVGGCSISLSAHSLADPSLMDYVLMQLTESMVPPGRLCFNFSEAAANANLEGAERLVRTLKEFGCRFTLEEFGSGDMAQGYLNNLPVDYLKISAMFTREAEIGAADAAVIKSLAEIGRLMGKKTIATGVAVDATVTRLKELGLDYVEGPGVAAPTALAEVA